MRAFKQALFIATGALAVAMMGCTRHAPGQPQVGLAAPVNPTTGSVATVSGSTSSVSSQPAPASCVCGEQKKVASATAIHRRKIHPNKVKTEIADKDFFVADDGSTISGMSLGTEPVTTIDEDHAAYDHSEFMSNDGRYHRKYDAYARTPIRESDEAFATEPHSMQPTRTGITSMTGQDMSIAIVSDTAPLTDPKAIIYNESTRAATRPLDELSVAAYDFDHRKEFQSAMNSRLIKLDDHISGLRAEARQETVMGKDRAVQIIDHLQTRQELLTHEVVRLDRTDKTFWHEARDTFRDRLGDLESDVVDLSMALK